MEDLTNPFEGLRQLKNQIHLVVKGKPNHFHLLGDLDPDPTTKISRSRHWDKDMEGMFNGTQIKIWVDGLFIVPIES